jgi:hypothetical protein
VPRFPGRGELTVARRISRLEFATPPSAEYALLAHLTLSVVGSAQISHCGVPPPAKSGVAVVSGGTIIGTMLMTMNVVWSAS